jgi:hypothetical protein
VKHILEESQATVKLQPDGVLHSASQSAEEAQIGLLPQSACSSGKETENTGTGSAADTISSDIPSPAPFFFFFFFRSSYLSLVFFPPILGLREEQE